MSKHLAITTELPGSKNRVWIYKEKQRKEFGKISKIGYKSENEKKKKRTS